MLLDALMAATDRLIVTYTGNDERTNARRPPAVPVGELLDVVDLTVRVDGGPAREHVEVRHPLQPFDPRNFAPGELVPDRSWGFDPVTLAGARALVVPARAAAAVPRGAAAGRAASRWWSSTSWCASPSARCARSCAAGWALRLSELDGEVDDALPVQLEPLDKARAGQRLLEACLAGATIDAAVAAERARGELPPGLLAEPVLAEIQPIVELIAARAASELDLATAPASVDVRVELPGGRTLRGTVPGVRGSTLGAVKYARLSPRHRLAAWVRFLALTASGRSVDAVTVGRGAGDEPVATAKLAPLDAAIAAEHLAALVDLRDRGHARAAAARLPVGRGLRPRRGPRARTRWRPGAASGSRRTPGTARTAIPSTSSRSAACSRSTSSLRSRPPAACASTRSPAAVWDGLLVHEVT